MITQLLFGIAIIAVMFTAKPIIAIRELLLAPLFDKDGFPKTTLAEFISDLLRCPQCFGFWLALPLWFAYPYIPDFIQYAIYLTAGITALDLLKTRLF